VDLASQAVNHDCHVLIEKPLSHDLKGVPELVALVRQKQVTGMVSCNMRFHPGIKIVKTLVEDRSVGGVIAARLHTGSFLPDWRPSVDYRLGPSVDGARGGGALLECIHEIDVALWLFGAARLAGAATLPTYLETRNAEGLAEVLVRHDSGVLSSIHLNFVQRDYRRFYEIIGETGTIYWDFHNTDVVIKRGAGQIENVGTAVNWDINQMYVDELTYFFECIDRHEKPFSTIEDGFTALKIALEARSHSGALGTK
jgi:predicted dehydrogenase